MKIKEIYFDAMGPYDGWHFAPYEKGLHVVYGPNESGKTAFLQGMRSLLFGFTPQEKKDHAKGRLSFLRNAKEYYLERHGKKLEWYALGEELLQEEPSKRWWHGLDRKTYERIFSLTIEDMQGFSILKNATVRTRFFGSEEGAHVAHMMQDMEKASADFLVTSTKGKRRIHLLVEQLEAQKATIATFMKQEETYASLHQALESLEITESEQQASFRQWEEYRESVAQVLRAWDTYQRMKEAKLQMSKLSERGLEEQATFQELDQEIDKARDMMRIWRGREEGLTLEDFSPDAPIGQYARDIERLHEEVSRWEQLQKEVQQGDAYLDTRKKQLAMVRKMQVHWREDKEFPKDVDWIAGEKASMALRAARSTYATWQEREPIVEGEGTDKKPPIILSLEELEEQGRWTEELRSQYASWETMQKALLSRKTASSKTWVYQVSAVICAVLTVVLYWLGRGSVTSSWSMGALFFGILGASLYSLGKWKGTQAIEIKKQLVEEIHRQEQEMSILAAKLNVSVPNSPEALQEVLHCYEKRREDFYGCDRELVKWHALLGQHKAWEEEGRGLQKSLEEAEIHWKKWCPDGVSGASTEDDYFAMQQEYRRFQEEYEEFQRQEKIVQEKREELAELERQAQELWTNLSGEGSLSTKSLRQLYQKLQLYRQHQVRWEQKESQRKGYRSEYDNWHRKEKDLLLRQEEIVQKNGFSSATEFRKQMISEGQYRQWETIYKQSRIQLDLLATTQDAKDLLLRRLREGKRSKWEGELANCEEQLQMLQRQLTALYEQRGKLLESIRMLSTDEALGMALQEQAHLEAALEVALEDWATYVFMGHFIDRAQLSHEEGKVPLIWERASDFTEKLTGGEYRLIKGAIEDSVIALSKSGERIPESHWSSGLGDQIYLALRLSLALYFSTQVDELPIVLDDALLRFDEYRQSRALEVLAEIGKDQQIWLLTCQESLFLKAKDAQKKGLPELHCYEFDEHRQLREVSI